MPGENDNTDFLANVSFDQLISDGPTAEPVVPATPPPADPPADPPPADPPSDPPADPPVDPNKPPEDPPVDPTTNDDDDDDDSTKQKDPPQKAPKDPVEPNKPDPNKDKDAPVPVINQVQEAFGYEFEDATFENSIDGVVDYAKASASEMAKEMVGNLLQEYPEAQQLINHLSQGNSIESFMKTVDTPNYMKMELTEDDIDTQRQVMEMKLSASGFGEDEVKDFIDNLDVNGKLYSTASKALDTLKADYQKQIEAQQRAEQEAYKQQVASAQKTWKEIEQTVYSGQVGEFKIPQSKQTAFFEYLSKPVDNNMTARDIKNQSLTTEQKLLIDYMIFSDFKINPGSRISKQGLDALATSNNKRENRLKNAPQQFDPNFSTKRKGLEGLDNVSFDQLINT